MRVPAYTIECHVPSSPELNAQVTKFAKQDQYMGGPRDDLRMIRYRLEQGAPGTERMYVAREADTGRILGFLQGCHQKTASKVEYFGTDVSVRGAGIGRALYEAFEKDTPHKKMRLKVEAENVGGVAFWKRMGFLTVSGESRLSMEKSL